MFMGEYNHSVDAKGRLIVPRRNSVNSLGKSLSLPRVWMDAFSFILRRSGNILRTSSVKCR